MKAKVSKISFLKFFRSFGGGVLGCLGTVGLLLLINSSILNKQSRKKPKTMTQFEIKKIKKKEIKRAQKKKKAKKVDSLKPDLKSMISGMSFGIPAFELDFDSGNDFLNNGNYVDGSKVDQKPKVLYRAETEFPEEALDKNISGFVTVGVFIDENGKLKKADILESSPKGVFDQSALASVKKWKFTPAMHKGVKVATWQEQRIVFNAEES